MSASWSPYCSRDTTMEIDGDAVVVRFEDERSHRVMVTETPTSYEFTALVAKRRRLRAVDELDALVWRRNRHAKLHGFRLDSRGRLMAFGWVPKVGLTSGEFRHVLRRVAVEADRFEFVLTGTDEE